MKTLMAESEEELKCLLMKVKEESEKAVLKCNIQKNDYGIWPLHFMANRCSNSENTDSCYFLGLQITADDDCSHEIKGALLLGRNAMKKPRECIKKQRQYFADKGL